MRSTEEAYRQLITKVTVPIALVVGLLLCSLLATLIVVAHYQTSVALGEQAKLAQGAVKTRGAHVEKTAFDYGSWDEAVERIVKNNDKDWADENIGKPVWQNLGFEMSFVVAPDGSTTYAMVDGQRVDRSATELVTNGLDLLLAKRRMGDGNQAMSGVLMANGKPSLVAVAPIRAMTADGASARTAHCLVLVDLIDPEMLKEFSHVYLLPQLKLLPAASHDLPSVPLLSMDDKIVGHLVWDGARPGDALLRTAVPVWTVVAVAFILLTGTILRQARSTAQLIADSEHQAKHDALTGLPNRIHLFERLDVASRALAEDGRGFAVAYLDLDGFKLVNDKHGHQAGDEVLRIIARRILDVIGDEDCLARIGGDEFCIILANRTEPSDVLPIGRAIIAAVEKPILVKDIVPVMVSATIGVTFAPADGADPILLLRNADEALYAGKFAGKRQVRFHMAVTAEELRSSS